MAHGAKKHCVVKTRKEHIMPILLWLVGIPIPLIILIMLLHH
jgi:hypothetical protein